MTRTENEPDLSAAEDWKPTEAEVAEYHKGEIEKSDRLTFEQRAGIQSYEDAIALLLADPDSFIESEELGDGFKKLTDKALLVGKNFVIVEWEYGKNTDYGEKFVIVRLVTENGDKFFTTDGSTGIMRQLELLKELSKGRVKRVICKGGLRASDFWVADEDNAKIGISRGDIVKADYPGKKKKATTYYIDAV